ncbi:hypothetical protein TPMD03_76 [Thiohalocapsa phage LS06-2018-MD03]|nr:hypothetical protein TPMD03_76 [Thiohalocapsa phage LS06-2018-MD03]
MMGQRSHLFKKWFIKIPRFRPSLINITSK